MPTKYNTLLLIHVFKANLSKIKKKKKNYDTRPKKRKEKTLSHMQSACDEASFI